MNAASSVLPMVRSHPLQLFKASPFRLPSFLLSCSRGPWGPFSIPHPLTTKPPPYVYVCVLSVHRWRRCASLSLPIDTRRCAAAGLLIAHSPVPRPPGGRRPGLVYVPCLGSLSVQPRTAGKTMIGPSRFLGAAPARDQAGFRWMSAVVGHGCDAI